MAGAGELRAYPTPFSDRATISFTTAVDENYSVRLYDMKGSLVRELKTGRATAGVANEVEVDRWHQPAGRPVHGPHAQRLRYEVS